MTDESLVTSTSPSSEKKCRDLPQAHLPQRESRPNEGTRARQRTKKTTIKHQHPRSFTSSPPQKLHTANRPCLVQTKHPRNQSSHQQESYTARSSLRGAVIDRRKIRPTSPSKHSTRNPMKSPEHPRDHTTHDHHHHHPPTRTVPDKSRENKPITPPMVMMTISQITSQSASANLQRVQRVAVRGRRAPESRSKTFPNHPFLSIGHTTVCSRQRWDRVVGEDGARWGWRDISWGGDISVSQSIII